MSILVVVLIIIPNSSSLAQADTHSFTALDLPQTSELSALGGVNVSRFNYNVTFFQNNPALASDSLDGWASANYLFYFAGTGLSSFSYQYDFKRIGSLNFGVTHLGLGEIQGYDILGDPTSTYTSGETTLVIGKAHQVNSFRFGVNLKGVFSNVAGYRATALLMDIGGMFVHPVKDLTVGLVIKNAGIILSEYSPVSSSRIPFDIQCGVSVKPEHMPVRFSATVYNLAEYDLPYEDNNIGNEPQGTLDKVFSHLTFGGELLVHRNVNVLLGYNFLKHKELKLEEAGGGSGFSVGARVQVKHFNFSFSRSGYVTGGAYQVSLNLNTNKILIRR